ncbi:MAG: PA2169 family four-helix-bundle protein [Lysobacteraceae bacterium]
MNHTNHTLNDLVEVARDGETFYEHAAVKVDQPDLRILFTRIAMVKRDIVKSLSSELLARGEKPADSGSWTGSFNKLYGDIRALLGNKDYAYVAQLEESEDRLLKGFEKAINDKETSDSARHVLTRLLPEVRNCHELMHMRKAALKKAA